MDPNNPIIDITAEPSSGRGSSSGQYAYPGAASSGPNIDNLFARRRVSFLLILSSVLLGALVWFWTRPNLYRATGSIFISRFDAAATPVTPAEMATEVEVLRSQAIELVTGASPDAPKVIESFETSDARRAAVRSKVSVNVVDNSQVIRVTFTDTSRTSAAAYANKLMDLYLQQRYLLLSRRDSVPAEAEGLRLNNEAESALLQLREFDEQKNGAVVQEAFRIQSEYRTSVESRILDLRAAIKGQEETLRALKRQTSTPDQEAEIPRMEAALAGMRGQLHELESELIRLQRTDKSTAQIASQRATLKLRADQAIEQSQYLAKKLQDTRLGGAALRARILTKAETIQVRSLDIPWWQLLAFAIGALLIASLGAWILDFFDRPVYSDEDFAKVAGAPSIKVKSTAAGK
jgi:capsular polysaccharide biosynthesis protein